MTMADLELNVLANLVTYPDHAFDVAERIGLRTEDFTDNVNRSAFIALRDSETRNPADLLGVLRPFLPEVFKTDAAATAFVNRAPSIAEIEHHLIAFLESAIRRQAAAETAKIYGNPNIPADLIAGETKRVSDDMQARLDVIAKFQSGNAAPDESDADGLPTPEELMDVPGFVNELAKFTFENAHRPNRVLAFAGALAMLSFLAGRKYTDSHGTRPNLYLVALADSGVGKDFPRKVNKRLADRVVLSNNVADQFGSGEGIEDSLYQYPTMLFQADEFDTILNSMKKESPLMERIYQALLTFFTDSSSIHTMRRKAMSQAEKEALMNNPTAAQKKASPKIYNPSLTLLATAIPDKFYSSLASRALDNGLLARCLIFEAGKRGEAGRGSENALFPDDLLGFTQTLANIEHNLPWGQRITPTVIEDGEGVDACRARITKEADDLYKKAETSNYSAGKAVWNRGVELTNKLALLYAISAGKTFNTKISVAGLEWGWKLVQHCAKRMLWMADSFIYSDQTDGDANTILARVKQFGRNGVKRSEIGRVLHLNADRLDKAEKTLIDRDQIEVIEGKRSAKIYRAKKTKGA